MTDVEDGIIAFQSLEAFTESMEKEHGIKLRFSEVISKMLIKNHKPEFVEHVISKVIETWHKQNFETVQEGLRGLNATLYGVSIALELPEDERTTPDNTQRP